MKSISWWRLFLMLGNVYAGKRLIVYKFLWLPLLLGILV